MATILNLINKDEATGEDIKYPSLDKLVIPSWPDYEGGARKNVMSKGSSDIADFTGTPQQLITKIGADFKATKTPSYRMKASGEMEEVPNCSFLVNSKTEEIIGRNISDRYQVFDFDNSILYYLSLLEEVKKKGMDVKPAYGKVYNGGARMFLQYKISDSNILGEDMNSYVALVTSHDKSTGFSVSYSMVRLFCQNQIHRMLNNAPNKTTLRHSKANQAKIVQEAEKIIKANRAQEVAMKSYMEYLAKIKVTDQNIFDAFGKIKDLESSESQRYVDNFGEQAGQLFACYNMPDVTDFKGTAAGAYYAFSDFAQHVTPLRRTKDETYMEQSLDGNEALSYFIDTLIDVAK